MKLRLSLLAALVVLCGTLACSASAIDQFTATSGTDVVTFRLPSSPSPDSTNAAGAGSESEFTFNNVSVTINGTTANRTINFWSGGFGGGFCISAGDVECDGGDIVNQGGPALFTGPVAAPTFLLGTTQQTDYTLGVPNDFSEPFTMTVSAVPEPSTLSLMLTGGLGLAGFLRRPRHA